jgi:uncharacterized protein
VIEQAAEWELTANQYVALPMIARSDGSIHCLNVLLRTALGLVEWCGDSAGRPLLSPAIEIDGQPQRLNDLVWERVDRWIPRFRMRVPDSFNITATLCAPTGYDASRRGAFYHFEIENTGATERSVTVALQGTWAESFQTAGTRRPIAAERRIATSSSRAGVALEHAGAISVALGIAAFGADTLHHVESADQESLESGGQRVLAAHESVRFSTSRTVRIARGRRAAVTFYLGVAAEREGALATAAAMRRLGAERLLKETRLELSRLSRKTRDASAGAILNRNLVFSYFFGVARGLDDERLYPVTSRSPLHPRCGTFNERDALLWALPALLLVDAGLVRDLILRCFEQFSHRPGDALRYVDGGVLEPGFTLDQWCGYVLSVAAYVETTGDNGLLDEPIVIDVLRELENGLYTKLHPEIFLAETERLPSGDAPDHRFTTYGNALVHAVFRALTRLRGEESAEGKRSHAAAEEIASAIWRRCVADVDGLPVLAFSTDLGDAASVYDDPAGSLQLLPHYGFCETSEPVWRNTVEFLRSPRYRLWLGDQPYAGLAARSAPTLANTAALCADLLGLRREEALRLMRKLADVLGSAATHYDPASGKAAGSPHDAALAGFIAWSLHRALNA